MKDARVNVGLLTEMMNIGGASTLVLREARWLSENGHGVVVFSSGGPLVADLQSSGIAHVEIPSFNPGVPFTPEQLAADGAALERVAREAKLDAVVGQPQWPFSLAAAVLEPRIAVYLHLLSARYWVPKTAAGLACVTNAYDKRRVLSTGMGATLAFGEEYGLDPAPVPTINVAIDGVPPPARSREAIREELGIARDAFVVLCVARLDADRAPMLPHLAAAIDELRTEYPALRLVITGDGTHAQALRNNIGERAIFTGYRRDLHDLYRSADLFVSEGSVIQDAAASGVPVIVTNSTMYPDRAGCAFSVFGMHLIDHYFMVPNNLVHPTPLKSAIALMLANPATMAALSVAGPRLVSEHWDLDAIMRWQVDFFGGGNPPPPVQASAEAVLEIDGGMSDDVDFAAALLARIERPERFAVRARRPVAWERFIAMPLPNAQALARAAWRATFTPPLCYTLHGRSVSGDVRGSHSDLAAALARMPAPPVNDAPAISFGRARESVTLVLAPAGCGERAVTYAGSRRGDGLIVTWEPQAEEGDSRILAAWRERHPDRAAQLLNMQGPVPWSSLGRLFLGVGTVVFPAEFADADRLELAARCGAAVDRY